MRLIRHTIACIILSTLTTGCFTGIESTPKITASDVKKENIVITPEQTFLTDIKGEPFSKWTSGKRLFVTDNRISQLLVTPIDEPLQGKYISFVDDNTVRSITGAPIIELRFNTPQGTTVAYRTDATMGDLEKRHEIDVPFTIEESVIKEVSSRLKGKTYYTTTSIWYDSTGNSFKGRKFVPVTVTDVKPGNTVYPILLEMSDEKGDPFRLYMSVGSDLKAPRGFNNLFAFADPRLKYPTITDATWANIINGKVARDMTRDECRLSLGSPAQVDRRPGYSYLYEIWTYENGIYLVFEDGLLKEFRR